MFEQTFRNIDDILWKDAGADSELDYIEQTSWVLFLRYLDELESERADEAVRQETFKVGSGKLQLCKRPDKTKNHPHPAASTK